MSRRLIIPARGFDADALYGFAVNAAGTASREDPNGREVRPAVRASTNIGGMNPIPLGLPDADVDVDILLRSSGNTDVARYGWRNHATGKYRGKQQSGVFGNVRLFASGDGAANRVSRPKLLALASGQLLLVYLKGDDANHIGGTSVAHRVWIPTLGWSVETDLGILSAPSVIFGVDAVQLPDTGEIVLMVIGAESYAGVAPKILRYVAADDSIGALVEFLAFVETPCSYQRMSMTLRGMAIEIMPEKASRIAMLCHDRASTGGLWRSYSDDRGVTWKAWAKAGQFGDATTFAPGSTQCDGGVALARSRNGALVALAPCLGNDYAPISYWDDGAHPRMRLLISDDGDNWNDALRVAQSTSGQTTQVTAAEALAEPGINDGAVVLGDDGFVRLYGALHGDSRSAKSVRYFDEIATLCLAKQDVSAADVGRNLTEGQAYIAASNSNSAVITSSDILDGRWDPVASAILLNTQASDESGYAQNYREARMAAGLSRCFSHLGDAAGNSGALVDLDTGASAVKRTGVHSLDAVSFRGAIWTVMASEFSVSGTAVYSLVSARTGNWCEHFELPPVGSSDRIGSNLAAGRGYLMGYVPFAVPEKLLWTATGSAADYALNTAGAGLRIASSAPTNFAATSLSGTAGQPMMIRACVVPTSGGDTASDNIALYVQQISAPASSVSSTIFVRFTATGFSVFDNEASANLFTVSGQDFSNGVEIILRFTAYNTLADVLYRALASIDVESDGAWTAAYGGIGGTPSANLTAGTDSVEHVDFGHFTSNACVSTWRAVQVGRKFTWATTPTLNSSRTALQINELAAASYPEVQDDANVFTARVAAYDDGLRHGSRAPVATAEPPQYVSRGMLARWGGAGGVADPNSAQDSWRATANYQSDVSRVRRLPVGNKWRSIDDAEASYFLFDAGTSRNWNHEALAVFKCNAPTVVVQFAASNSWGSPAVSITCNTTDGADVRRDIYRRLTAGGAISIESAGASVIRLAGDATTPLTPHRYESTDARSYWVFSSVLNKTAKILDNDGSRLFLDRDMTGADGAGAGDYIAIYADTFYFPLGTPGVLATSGYRWMRIGIGDAADLAEGFQEVGLVIAGDAIELSDPHPDWGWREQIVYARAMMETPAGYRDIAEIGPVRRAWTFSFDFALPPLSRATPAIAPGKRAQGWEKLLYGLLRLHAGSEVCALLPDYGNLADDGPAGWGNTERVYPVRFTGSPELVHMCYERCRTDGTDDAYKALSGCGFEEVP